MHAVIDVEGRPIRFFMTAGQVSDYTAAALLDSLPKAEWLLADRSHDADYSGKALHSGPARTGLTLVLQSDSSFSCHLHKVPDIRLGPVALHVRPGGHEQNNLRRGCMLQS